MKKLIGTVKAIELKNKYFLLTVPREVVEKLDIKKGDLYLISVTDEDGSITYEKAMPQVSA